MGNLAPLGNNVIVKPVAAEEVRKSGIIIPDTAKERNLRRAKSSPSGRAKLLKPEQSCQCRSKLRPCDLCQIHQRSEMKIDGEKYLIMPESDILAIRPTAGASTARGKK